MSIYKLDHAPYYNKSQAFHNVLHGVSRKFLKDIPSFLSLFEFSRARPSLNEREWDRNSKYI